MAFINIKEFGAVEQQIQAVAQPLIESLGLELVHIECVVHNRQKFVRIYMDKPKGVGLDDCVAVSRELGDLIDIHIEDIGPYRLEVSSPGPNRPLKTRADFIRFQGERIKIETHEIIEGRKKFTGILEKTNDDSVTIAVDGRSFDIAGSNISRANLAGQ
ncbi:ribosome maturation factor RimP [uncultured Desulfobacter sp.]|uniref:ribosome maturation factor RimP n=1 Tax=uncultured Desulfobacter sp. TaxID=240139 RepID=UPI002AABC666|nr:ribosome maturation factor RimP [uncultured Desulfobacter sp.]